MAKSIKDVGKKVESKLSTEIAKKEGEELKEAISSLPSGAKVRILKMEDGVKKYIATVGIEEYDKTDPYAWLKRRFVKKYGDGEYILEFISSDGEIIRTTTPILIEGEKKEEEVIKKEEEEFLKKINEALKIKEEAIEHKAKLEKEKAELETEKARTVIELAEKQIDMITRLYDEKIKMIEERFKKSEESDMTLLMMELNRIKDEYMMAIQQIERTIERMKEEQTSQPQYMDMVMQFLLKSMEKDKFEEVMKMITLMKELTPKEENKKDIFEELIENPQKIELFKKMIGLDRVEEIRREISELFRYAFEKEQQQEPKKDIIDEALESFEKMRRLKDILQPVLGIQPQPAKSFVELIATILQSPQVPQIVQALAQSMTQTKITEKMIEMGYIPAELAGRFVKPEQLNAGQPGYAGYPVEQQPQQPQTHKKQTKKSKNKEEEDMIKNLLINAINKVAPNVKDDTTTEQFAKMIAKEFISIGEQNHMIAAQIIFMDKKKRKKIFIDVLKQIVPDMTKEMAEEIYETIEKEIKEYIEKRM